MISNNNAPSTLDNLKERLGPPLVSLIVPLVLVTYPMLDGPTDLGKGFQADSAAILSLVSNNLNNNLIEVCWHTFFIVLTLAAMILVFGILEFLSNRNKTIDLIIDFLIAGIKWVIGFSIIIFVFHASIFK